MKPVRFAILSFTFIFLSLTAHAHNFQNEACDVNINGEIVLANNQITITTEESDVVLLTKAGSASVNGKNLSLSAEESASVSNYVASLEAAVPQAIALAAKAIELTNTALTDVFTGLLGEDSQLPKMLNDKLNALQQKLESHIYQQPEAVTFNSAFFTGNEQTQSEFESDFDAAVEEVMSTAMGELLVSFGRSMLSGGSSMQNFEEKMSALGDTIETTVEEQSQSLKEDALALCETLERADKEEQKLQRIDGFKDINFLTVKPNKA
ncbi:DUF2884 family protein [Glaciecola siphonariae]|uniref:DUF2884 family protein n=1 Tax=Glaciecola siphonariae TaxID=521012 RepID=A0ABV9M0V1_9ALTE